MSRAASAVRNSVTTMHRVSDLPFSRRRIPVPSSPGSTVSSTSTAGCCASTIANASRPSAVSPIRQISPCFFKKSHSSVRYAWSASATHTVILFSIFTFPFNIILTARNSPYTHHEPLRRYQKYHKQTANARAICRKPTFSFDTQRPHSTKGSAWETMYLFGAIFRHNNCAYTSDYDH